MFKRWFCVFISALLLLGTAPVASLAAYEVCDCGRNPVIYVNGLNACDLIRDEGTDSRRVAFPFDASVIPQLLLENRDAIWDMLDGKYSEENKRKIVDTVCSLLSDVEMTSDGESLYDVTADWRPQTNDVHREGGLFAYNYDWRLDPFENAEGLADFIAYVKELTGHDEVDILAESLGGTVFNTYLSVYGTEGIGGIIWFCGAQSGVMIANEAFNGRIHFDAQEATSFLHEAMPDSFEYQLLSLFMQGLADIGITGGVLRFANRIVKSLTENGGFREILLRSFGKMPGVWACVDDSAFESAKAYIFPTDEDRAENAGLIEKIDRYHYDVQANMAGIMRRAQEETGKIAVISHYGFHLAPVVPDSNVMSDRLVDSAHTSCGATFARYGEVLKSGELLSPDKMVDASTALFPEWTWIVRGLMHGEKPGAMRELFRFIYDSEGQPTVSDSEKYPQFLAFDKNSGELGPQTGKARPAKLAARIRELFLSFIRVVKAFFGFKAD